MLPGARMIVCSCTLITSKDVAEAVVSLRSNDPFVLITPALIYRHLGKRPSCGNCLPLIMAVSESKEPAEAHHRIHDATGDLVDQQVIDFTN
jgi:bacterioferritin-associated ferredoxin